MRSLLLLTLLGLLVTACQGGESLPSPSPSASSEQTGDASRSADASHRSETPTPSTDGSGAGVEISGAFTTDSIEGGCAFLEADDGTRYEVVWPDGWTLLRNPFRLQDPGGDIVASGGETITVRGQEASDMASICMVGPIFRASEVVTIDR